MEIPPSVFQPLDQFPVPWASHLPDLVGNVVFHLDLKESKRLPEVWLGVVSSHASKFDFARPLWQKSLFAALQLASHQRWGVMFAWDGPCAAVVRHTCSRLSLPFLEVQTGDAKKSVKTNTTPRSGSIGVLRLIESGKERQRIPISDRAVVMMADRVFAVEVRRGGKIDALLNARLGCPKVPSASTYLPIHIGESGQNSGIDHREWLGKGAVGWIVQDDESSKCLSSCRRLVPQTLKQPILGLTKMNEATDFFVHCTRSRSGPWPDQTLAQFHDEIIQAPWQSWPSPFQSLERILLQQRLIATNNFRRGDLSTVCFSAKPLRQLLGMRRYQSHIGRWDWEPYGIMIRREWLLERGVREVKYISHQEAKKRSPIELAYSQIVNSDATDWSVEQEWRLEGDLRLAEIPSSKALVFVPTFEEARALQSYSRWPIVVTQA